MIYTVKAKIIQDKMHQFYQKLSDGTISNQKPDGKEIIDSMRRAKITQSEIVQWSEMCFCPTPLKHERNTVYDNYFSEIQTKEVADYIEFEGQAFMDYLSKV